MNSLAPLADVDKTIAQIKSVTKPGGIFLLLVEVNPRDTLLEYIRLVLVVQSRALHGRGLTQKKGLIALFYGA